MNGCWFPPHRSDRPLARTKETLSSSTLPGMMRLIYVREMCVLMVRSECNYENSFVFTNDFATLKQRRIALK
jgi:galactose-1-phosphate uridylyltransferase